MAHRNSLPKTKASLRTQYRYRMRHNTPTEYDKKRSGIISLIKQTITQQKPSFKKIEITREQIEKVSK